ncbi:Uncharacterised protein [Bordetella pertussis]|nr:Uncharacterised protein [Bordetella pertussis]CFO31644.1 Uncharacterised protein [Bordetella pertussis]CFW05170.1 Uncharacterised protein [Bordetella pertussis]CPM15902.1 Uncharacterised protein [Bordetella pertussis]CPO95813.1 Uncharacterised protein [Bordetella pertussis]
MPLASTRVISNAAGAPSRATSRSNSGRTAINCGAGHTVRSSERTTGRPPNSSRLADTRTLIGECVPSVCGSISSCPAPVSSSSLSGSSS